MLKRKEVAGLIHDIQPRCHNVAAAYRDLFNSSLNAFPQFVYFQAWQILQSCEVELEAASRRHGELDAPMLPVAASSNPGKEFEQLEIEYQKLIEIPDLPFDIRKMFKKHLALITSFIHRFKPAKPMAATGL